MTVADKVHLFILQCAVIESDIRILRISSVNNTSFNLDDDFVSEGLDKYIKQFDASNRNNAEKMARYYRLFYMLENDIRQLIIETMEVAHGPNWWTKTAPPAVKDEAAKNRAREEAAAVSPRSDEEIDYTTFGQLGDFIRHNWTEFAGIMSNQAAMGRVLSALNMLRGNIAHCGILAEDEVDRLKLAIKDWFRVLQGPKS